MYSDQYILVLWFYDQNLILKTMIFLGLPKRAGEENQQCAGLEALCPGAYRRQQWWFLLGQSPDAGAEHTLGDHLCTFYLKADAARSSLASGKNHARNGRVHWKALKPQLGRLQWRTAVVFVSPPDCKEGRNPDCITSLTYLLPPSKLKSFLWRGNAAAWIVFQFESLVCYHSPKTKLLTMMNYSTISLVT